MGKKIAIVANTTWNIFNFRLNVIAELVKRGHQVVVVAPVDEFMEYKERFPSVEHVALRVLDRDGKNPFRDFILIEELRRKYKNINPDLVLHYTHKPNIYGAIAAHLNGITSIAAITGLGYAFIHSGWVNKITKALYKLTSKYHRKFIFENTDDLQLFIDDGVITADKGISVKGCGVDTEHFQPSANGVFTDKLVFTFIGRLLYDKGIIEFIEAAKAILSRFISVEFWVIGEFDEGNPSTINKDRFVEWVNEGIIVYHGFVRDVRPFIKKSNCIVLPSVREGMPRIVLEGMAMGKPIITTRTAGCRETVEEGVNGFLVDVKNAKQLEESIEKFIALSEEEKIAMGVSGRKKAETIFNDNIIANQLCDIIEAEL